MLHFFISKHVVDQTSDEVFSCRLFDDLPRVREFIWLDF